MFAISKRALIYSNIAHHANYPPRCYYEPLTKYASCFSSITDQGPTTPGKLSQKDGTLEGSQGGYGGSGISDTPNLQAVESPTTGTKPGPGERLHRREDAAGDMTETAKAGAIRAMEAGLKFGEMGKQAVDGMWDAARETTERVRDTVADDIDNNKQTPGGQAGDPRRGPRGYN